jgi:hypothetical protein
MMEKKRTSTEVMAWSEAWSEACFDDLYLTESVQ